MVQLVAIGLVGGLVWYGYKVFKREMARVGNEIDKNQRKAEKSKADAVDALEMGEDGVYRVKNQDSSGKKND